MIEAGELSLGELISILEKENPNMVCPIGFENPHCDRGYYANLAFTPARNVTVGQMLATAKTALGATFEGYKGGEYTMREYTTVYLGTDYSKCGEGLGRLFLSLLLDAGRP